MVEALDGNSIGGLLIDVFGADMTAASSTCGTCGAVRPVAELVVYRRGPRPRVRRRTGGRGPTGVVEGSEGDRSDPAGRARPGETGPVFPQTRRTRATRART